MTLLFTLFGLGFDSGGVLDDRVDVHRADSSERRADPVDDAVLHVGVALAAELEAGGSKAQGGHQRLVVPPVRCFT